MWGVMPSKTSTVLGGRMMLSKTSIVLSLKIENGT